MRVLAINGGTTGSSWNICCSILNDAKSKGIEPFIATPNKQPSDCKFQYYRIGNRFDRFWNRIITRIDGSDGFRNTHSTKKLLKYIDLIMPDVVHLHTMHGYFINIELLLSHLKEKNIKTIITCHDCWWFTGRCSHFQSNNCQKWKNDKCKKCEFKNVYPRAFIIDNANKYLETKKNIFCNYNNLVVVCVSNWLTNLCKESYVFHDKNVVTIHNGINIRQIDNFIDDCTLYKNDSLISVASQWNKTKGFDLLLKLADSFPDKSFYVVGKIDNSIKLPKNVISIPFTDNKIELMKKYTLAKAFLNTSKQETFSLVNIEAQLCGLPVICLKSTGMAETASPYSFFVDKYDLDEFKNAINKMFETPVDSKKIREFAKTFSEDKMNSKYIELYQK